MFLSPDPNQDVLLVSVRCEALEAPKRVFNGPSCILTRIGFGHGNRVEQLGCIMQQPVGLPEFN